MTGEELDVQLAELEVRLERLRALYEQYFLGFEKLEPTVARKDFDRRIWALRHENIRNTARRFKLQTIVQRYNTFQQYWQRICREIENGTYRRHLARAERIVKGSALLTIAARRRAGLFRQAVGDESVSESGAPPSEAPASAAPPPASEAVLAPPARPALDTLDLDMGFFDGTPRPPRPAVPAVARAGRPPAPPPVPQQRLAPPPPRRTAAPPLQASPGRPEASTPRVAPPAAASATSAASAVNAAAERRVVPGPKPDAAPASLSEDRLRELHARLIDVKRQNNERGNVSLDKLARSLRDAEAKLREKHAGRRVDFDVVVKNGKAVLKPILRRR